MFKRTFAITIFKLLDHRMIIDEFGGVWILNYLSLWFVLLGSVDLRLGMRFDSLPLTVRAKRRLPIKCKLNYLAKFTFRFSPSNFHIWASLRTQIHRILARKPFVFMNWNDKCQANLSRSYEMTYVLANVRRAEGHWQKERHGQRDTD